MIKRAYILIASACLFYTIAAAQQIPNGSFEEWTAVGIYEMPENWDNLNPSTDTTGIFTCTKGTPASAGTYFINLTSTWVPGLNSVVPGIAVCGTIDQASQMPVSGFAFSDRPQEMTGLWQYMSYGGDAGFIEILLTHWNEAAGQRDTVAYAHHKLSGMVHSWTDFSIPLTYSSGSFPDSCIIVLDASGLTPADFDFLWVDDLAFTGSVISSVPSPDRVGSELEVFPNPAGDEFTVRFSSDRNERVILVITDEKGVQLQNTACDAVKGLNVFPTFIGAIVPGVYLVTIRRSSDSITKKIIVQ